MAAPSHRETEIKLRLPGAAEGRKGLRAAGFRVLKRRVYESNIVFDNAAHALRRAGALLRLRQAGGRALVTYKGPAASGRYKSREELEIEVPDGDGFALILARLGFQPVFRYEKYRTEYAEAPRRGVATLDETPIGAFLELEGEPRWIDRAAARLGFRAPDYITATYAGLYLRHRRQHPGSPPDMVF